MEDENNKEIENWLWALVKTFIFCSILCFAIPVSLSVVINAPVAKTLSLIASTFALEYFAVPVGIALGLNPAFVLIVMTFVALSIVRLLVKVFDTVGERSKRVSDFLAKSRRKAQSSKLIRKYGMYGLVPGAALFGFYVCPAIAWVLGWRKDYAIFLIVAGFVLTCIIMLLATLGILELKLKWF